MMEEDFERAREMEMMYAIEKQREMEEEWQRWEEEQEEQNRQPAVIKVVTPTEIEYEDNRNTLPF